jgi:hypothetical protein
MDKNKIISSAQDTYSSFDKYVSINEGDSTLVIIGKIMLRLLGVLVLILLSPFLLIGLFIAFIAVL